MAAAWTQHTARKGHYSRKELSYLSTSLGLPRTFFAKAFESSSTMQMEWNRLLSGRSIRESALTQLLDSKVLDSKLEKVFNMYPAKYNIKLIKKALSLIRHRKLTFPEISDARVTFEVHVCDDGSGILADLQAVMQSLKFLERVISPLRLEAEIQKYQLHSEVPTRFQMYEFLDLVAMCEKREAVETQMTLSSPHLGNIDVCESDIDLSLPDFEEILMTSDQKMHKYLDSKYRASLYREVEPTPVVLDTEHIVSSGPRRSLVSVAHKQSCALTPSLEHSQSQLHRARSGYMVLSPQHHRDHEHNSPDSLLLRSPTRLPPDKRMDPLHSSYTHVKKSLRFHFNRVPRAQMNKPTLLLPQASSQSDIERQQTCNGSDRTDKRIMLLTSAIDDVCVGSVVKARSALKSSLASLPQLQQLEDQEARCASPSEPSRVTLESFAPASSVRSPTPDKVAKTGQTHKLHFEPVVSEGEVKLQQGLIDELEWNALRRRAASVIKLKPALQKGS